MQNNSTDTVLYQITCSDSLEKLPELVLIEEFKKDDSVYYLEPQYLISPNSSKPIGIHANWEETINNCPDKRMRVFFISKETLESYSWSSIVQEQLYERKYVISAGELKEKQKVVVYNPQDGASW